MKERLVDVKMGERGVVHTFPITISDPLAETNEKAFTEKALEAAAHAKVLEDDELEGLSAQMHVSRSGPLEPDHDPLSVLAETKEGLDQFVRDRAYFLWEQAGRPDGAAEEFWHKAQHQRWCERAYALWWREGCQAGNAHQHWYRIRDFEQN
ncbi:MAG: DUF2934 domain-containing protein [Steroidobacteraceae bacterium]